MNDNSTVLWTSKDKAVAIHMAFMYAKNAKLQGWFSGVEVVGMGIPLTELLKEGNKILTV